MVLRSFEALGLDTRRLCAAAGLSHAQLNDPDARLPRDFAGALWRAASRRSGDPHLGLHAGERIPPAANNLLAHMVISSPTLLEGLRRTIPYQRVLAHGRIVTLERRADVHALCFSRVDGDLPITRNETEFLTAAFMRLCRFAVGRRWRLARVRFELPVPVAIAEYERVFACPVDFAQPENSLLVPANVMTEPLAHHCPSALAALEAAADAALARVQQPSLAGEVRARILVRLRERRRDCGVDTVSAALHVSPRTLQRRLEAEHTSFSNVLEEAQRDRCIELLDSDATLDEIGTAIGLSGARALGRAFRRWTGRTPSEYRSLHRA